MRSTSAAPVSGAATSGGLGSRRSGSCPTRPAPPGAGCTGPVTLAAGSRRARLEIAGRMDRQLKVRGYRIEPGEIESVLAGHPDIDEVSVVATSRHAGDSHLVAYYTPTRAAAQTALHHPRAASLRRYLLDRLPSYMIPAAFIARHPKHVPAAKPGTGAGHSPGAGRTRPVPGAAPPRVRRRSSRPPRRDSPPCGAGCSPATMSALTTSSSRSAATPCSPRRCWCAPTPSSASRRTRCARLPAACSAIPRCAGSRPRWRTPARDG